MNYIRILYLVSDRATGTRTDSYVLSYPKSLGTTIETLITCGFERKGSNYDPETRIMPGAILAITPCDSRGYSQADRNRNKL